MKGRKELSPADQERLEEFMKRFNARLKQRPTMSDEEFMAETEVSDEQYTIGLVLPGIGREDGGEDE
jgi:HSP20 family molecular chaperone IbpA